MRTTITKQVEMSVCDLCNKARADWDAGSCLGCGIDVCHGCYRGGEAAVQYPTKSSTYSGDPVYCTACDARLRKTRESALHNALVARADILREYGACTESFCNRLGACEKEIKRLLESRKGGRARR